MQTALITGSTRGIGLAAAEIFLKQGHNAVISSESEADVARAAQGLGRYKEQVLALKCDISSRQDVDALARAALDRFGAVDVWINNAALQGPIGTTFRLPRDIFSALVDVNIKGSFYGCVRALRLFEKQGHGKLINVVGRGDTGPVTSSAFYSSSKYWLAGMTRVLAKENKNKDIGVCTFNPGLVRTRRTEQVRVLKGEDGRMGVLPKVMGLIGSGTGYPAGLLYRIAMKPAAAINAKAFKASYLKCMIDNLLHKKPPHRVEVQLIEPEQDESF